MEVVALQIASSLLPTLVTEISAGLRAGHDEVTATRQALERMRANPIPAPLAEDIASRYARARAEQP